MLATAPNQDRFFVPIAPFDELMLSRSLTVPEIFLRHREHHGEPALDKSKWAIDTESFSKMSPERRGVFVHVQMRFIYGLGRALEASEALREAVAKTDRRHHSHYDAIAKDTRYLIGHYKTYLREVAGVTDDPGALTPAFRKIFDDIFPSRIAQLLGSFKQPRIKQVRAEAMLRVDLHLIGEGLGAITGVWGMNAAVRELAVAASGRDALQLPGMVSLLADTTKIMRRNIAMGLSEMGELAWERYYTTVRASIDEICMVKPILEDMRMETFGRWGGTFPFAIDPVELSNLGTKRVVGWLVGHVVTRPGCLGIPRKHVWTLRDIL